MLRLQMKISYWAMRHKKLFISLYTILMSIMFLIIVVLSDINIFWMPPFILFFAAIAWMFVLSSTHKIFIQAGKDFENDLDPDKYLEIINELILTLKTKTSSQALLIDKALCMARKGNVKQSLDILKSINIDKFHVHPLIKIAYYNNLCGCYMSLKNNEMAGIWLDKACQIAADIKGNSKGLNLVRKCLEANKKIIDMYDSNFEGVKDFLLDYSEKAYTKMQKITAEFNLGEFCYLNNNMDEARLHFNYVIENGKQLNFVDESKDYISKMNIISV